MDKLSLKLREDAALINVEVSDELDDRIRASLESVSQERPDSAEPRKRGIPMWWASSLTGIAVALLIIIILDRNTPEPPPVSVNPIAAVPDVQPQLDFRSAVFTAPLEKELADLESDLRKAEQAVREDIGLDP